MANIDPKDLNLHVEILPKATKNAFEFLAKESWLGNSRWYLAGGTALALQVGHRESVDLDFFSPEAKFSEGALVDDLKKGPWEETFIQQSTIYGKVAGAKVSFIGYPFFIPREPFIPFGNIHILRERDIAVMKIIALSQRGTKRDFVDLYWYAKNREPLDEVMLRVPDQYPEKNHNFHHFIRSLTYFDDAENDAMPKVNFDTNWDRVKAYFLKETPRIARKILVLGQ